MKKKNLTTRLNARIVFVVVCLMTSFAAYSSWLTLQQENNKNEILLTSITKFLANQTTTESFSALILNDSDSHSPEAQQSAIIKEIHPILHNIFVPTNSIKFGYYLNKYDQVVAIGPDPSSSLLITLDPSKLEIIRNAETEQLLNTNQSFVWPGSATLLSLRPVKENGVIVATAFATINQDNVSTALWQQAVIMFSGAIVMLFVCVAIFRELFIRLKKDLRLYAESIVDNRTDGCQSEVAEFTPVLKYLSEQTEKMTRLDRLDIIGEMAAGIAHEIRNPMTTVRGFLQLLSMKADFVNQKEMFELMIDELDRANSIITEFLSLAKNRDLCIAEHNVNTVIQEIYPLLQADAIRRDCHVNIILGEIPAINIDQSSIRQLILNLVRNGLDAMPESGSIIIRTVAVDSKVLLSVQDNGTGIPPEIKDKLGTPFFTTKEKGTGLGLAICYRLAQIHSATMSIDSELGQGTTVTIEFSSV